MASAMAPRADLQNLNENGNLRPQMDLQRDDAIVFDQVKNLILRLLCGRSAEPNQLTVCTRYNGDKLFDRGVEMKTQQWPTP
jgi:hypothetical protein